MPPAVPLKFPALVKQAQDSKGNAHCRFVRLCWVGSLHSGREALELPGLLELGGMQMSFISLSPWLASLSAGMAPPTTFEWPLKMGCVVHSLSIHAHRCCYHPHFTEGKTESQCGPGCEALSPVFHVSHVFMLHVRITLVMTAYHI